jgi:hypothetical protein
MGFFSKLFGGPQQDANQKQPEHAVLVYLNLTADAFGTEDERDNIHQLSDLINAAIVQQEAGEFDGDEFGGGQCTLFMYGPDADQLFAAIEPVIRSSPLTRGGHAIKRYGDADDPDAREERVEF